MSKYIIDRENIQVQFKNHTYEWDFNALALAIFNFQFLYNPVYGQFCELLGVKAENVKQLDQIPFLPIEFFKSHTVKTGEWDEKFIFKSSGTAGQNRSRHFIRDLEFYLHNARLGFVGQFGQLSGYCFLAILPGYVERSDSSLIFMVNDFISMSNYENSGYYLGKNEELIKVLEANKDAQVPTVLIGVSFALLDLCSIKIDYPELIVIETGGMKNSKIDLEKKDILARFKKAWNVKQVSSEYGMTELLSQSYARDGKWYKAANTKRVVIGNLQDPLAREIAGKAGIIKVIDLANFDTCSFIETQDLGIESTEGKFQVLGRMNNAEIRGCNLLLDDSLEDPIS